MAKDNDDLNKNNFFNTDQQREEQAEWDLERESLSEEEEYFNSPEYQTTAVSEEDIAEMEEFLSGLGFPNENNKETDLQGELNAEVKEEALKEHQNETEVAKDISEARKNESEASANEPEAAAIEPEAVVIEPEAAVIEPEAAVIEPEAVVNVPEAVANVPEVVVNKPEAAVSEPEAKNNALVETTNTPSSVLNTTNTKKNTPKRRPQKTVLDSSRPIRNPDQYTSPSVVDHQRYLLAVDELSKPQNEVEFDAFVRIVADKVGLDPQTATAEDLTKIDTSIANVNLEAMETSSPISLKTSNDRIDKNFDVQAILAEAGLDIKEKDLPIGFNKDIKVLAAFDERFGDGKGPSLKERLKGMKDDIVNVVRNDDVKTGLATLSFGLAVSAGAVTLPIAGALYAAKLMENEKVQTFANNLHSKVSKSLVKMGFKEEAVNEREELLGDKFKAISESKWGKVAKIGLTAGVLGFGVHSLIELTDFSIDKIPQYYADSTNYVSKVFSGDVIPGQDTYAFVKDKVVDYVEKGEFPGKDAYESFKHTLGTSVLDEDFDNNPEINGSPSQSEIDELIKETREAEAAEAAEAAKNAEAPEAATNVETETSDTFDIVAEKNDTAWTLASEHYEAIVGEKPTPQQVVAMVNDLGLDDPNAIQEGQVLKFNSDLSEYKDVTNIKASDADWLQENDAVNSTQARTHLSDAFNVNHISNGASLADLKAMNPDIELDNLLPGDEVKFSGDNGDIQTYVVPSIEDAAIKSIYPGGVSDLVNKDALFELIENSNKDIDLSDGYFGNGDLGRDIVNKNDLTPPEIDINSVNPEVTGKITVEGKNSMEQAILKVAYPNGVPELLDKSAFLDAVKEANPNIRSVGYSETFNEEIVIPDFSATSAKLDASQIKSGSTISGEASDTVKKSFLNRVMNNDAETTLG
ncbi:hypothetical protein [Psychromonas sp. SP041]|uniref:hypothetical protein n=1 Tax=Psychromonas sp. SP041 TaxID=1365007 RepID=UPI0010C7AAF1|nr:hypothetical protein [Psychromonas sp. SP041]